MVLDRDPSESRWGEGRFEALRGGWAGLSDVFSSGP